LVDLGNQFGSRITLDRAAHLSAHSAGGTDHSNSDHARRLGAKTCPPAAPSTTVGLMLAAIGDTPYNIMLFLHILTGVVAFAPAFTHPVIQGKMERAGFDGRSTVIGYMASYGMKIYGSALVLCGLLGFGVAGMSDDVFELSQGWLVTAVIVWIVMNGLLHGAILPSEKAIGLAGPDGAPAAEKKLAMAGGLITVLFLVQLYLMVFRPGL